MPERWLPLSRKAQRIHRFVARGGARNVLEKLIWELRAISQFVGRRGTRYGVSFTPNSSRDPDTPIRAGPGASRSAMLATVSWLVT